MDSTTPCQLDLERKIVRHCSPTLAALKPANLFTCRDELKSTTTSLSSRKLPDSDAYICALTEELRTCRAKLAPCGVRLEVMARRRTGALVYAYRPALLADALAEPRVSAYLRTEGYDPHKPDACIERLRRRICGTDLQSRMSGSCSFPHEIGFFLGYPYEDVVGFIQNNGEGFLCCGCWKVYARERDAQACFCRYRACTTAYESLFNEGVPIECLASIDDDFPAAEAFGEAV